MGEELPRPDFEIVKGTRSAPAYARVRLNDGSISAIVPRWTMAKRDAMKPRVHRALSALADGMKSGAVSSLAGLFEHLESEICEICEASIELPSTVSWDQLPWTDLPLIAQAVFELNLSTPANAALAKKALGRLGPLFGVAPAVAAQPPRSSEPPSPSSPPPMTKSSEPNPPVSHSSPGDGEPIQSA